MAKIIRISETEWVNPEHVVLVERGWNDKLIVTTTAIAPGGTDSLSCIVEPEREFSFFHDGFNAMSDTGESALETQDA